MHTQSSPAQEVEFDVVVAGGGMAGLCAAIAAARHGLRTALVQDRPVLGGCSSSEIRVAPQGAATFNTWARETGILEEMLLTERAGNHTDVYDGMATSRYDLVLFETAKREPGLTMYLNTTVREVEVDASGPSGARRIVALRASQLATEKEFRVRATQFADCTGDATVGALAGADFRYGREGRAEFNEPLAPDRPDNQTMGSTLTMRARDIGRPVPFVPPDWIQVYKTQEEIGVHREPGRFNGVDYGGYWWIELGTPYDQIADNQTIKEELLRHVLGVWNYVKNHSPQRGAATNYALEWIGMVPGKRESRRLMGDVILTEHDCHHDRQWPDRVLYAGWFLDLHTMGGILSKKEPGEPAWSDLRYRNWGRVPPFSIPLRALYSRNVSNLWMAGRNISVTHVALGATRVQMTHSLQGQAIGTAAAYAVQHGLTPRQTAQPDGPHIRVIQQQLLKDDANAFGVRNEDAQDLARTARAIATSDAALDMARVAPEEWVSMETDARAMVFPSTNDRLEEAELFLGNAGDTDLEVAAELQELDQLWQREAGKIVAKFTFRVKAQSAGWVKAMPGVALHPGRPHRLALQSARNLSWARTTCHPVGVLHQFQYCSPGGCEPQNLHMPSLVEIALPAYAHWTQARAEPALATRLHPAPRPFGAANANNGYAWPFVMPNLWVSDPAQKLPQAVTLDFGAPRTFNTVYASFDTHLKHAYHDMRAFHRAHTCARNWRLLALCDGAWKQVYEEKDNYHRRRKAVFPAVTASQLRLEVLGTNATVESAAAEGDSARVYEIRVYHEGV